MALDALRGFDMFWIIGMDTLAEALDKVSHASPSLAFFARQISHADWAGFRFYDLIFPMFVFIVGVSLVFSLTRLLEREGRAGALRRVFWRATLLYLLGIFYYGGLSGGFEKVRLRRGERRTVSFPLTEADLAFVRADMSSGAEPGEFTALVGRSSEDVQAVGFRLEPR